MKIVCRVCVVHFADEFEDTLKAPCNFWGDIGLSNISNEDKKKFWDWSLTTIADEFFVKYNLRLNHQCFFDIPTDEEKVENSIPNYKTMSEEEKKQAQKEYFKEKIKREQQANIKPVDNIVKVSETKN